MFEWIGKEARKVDFSFWVVFTTQARKAQVEAQCVEMARVIIEWIQ